MPVFSSLLRDTCVPLGYSEGLYYALSKMKMTIWRDTMQMNLANAFHR